jgi:hypothetical protein
LLINVINIIFIIFIHKNKSIVGGGETYLIDVNSKEQLNKSEFSDTKTAILYEQEETIYYSNGFNIRYLDNKYKVKISLYHVAYSLECN